MNLTPKQSEVLDCIRRFRVEHGYAPTLREIAETLGVSKITVLQHLRALERRGAIRRRRREARAIEICDEVTCRFTPSASVVGTIADGEPIEALGEDETKTLASAIGGDSERFFLRVRGDALLPQHVHDGDYLVCERRSDARDREKVIVSVSGGPTMLRTFRFGPDGAFYLEPALAAGGSGRSPEIIIHGVVIAVLRKCR